MGGPGDGAVTRGRMLTGVRPLALLPAVLALAVAACAGRRPENEASRPEPSLAGVGETQAELIPSGAIVFPHGGGATAPDAERKRRPVFGEDDDRFFQEKFDLAQAAVEAGDDETAIQLIGCALALHPPDRWDAKLKGLRQTIKARHLELDVVRADARGARDYVVFGESVDFVVRLRNLGGRDLVVTPPAGPGEAEVSGSVLALTVRRIDRDIYSTSLGRSWTQVVPLVVAGQPDLVVAPERSHEVRVRVPADEVGGPISGIRILEVSGDLRLTGASVGIAEPIGRVPIRVGRVTVVPRNYEPVATDPLRSLKKALNVVAPVHVLVAVEFLPPGDRAAAVQAMADALAAGDDALVPAVHSSLAHLRERIGDGPAGALAEPLILRLRTHPARSADVAEGLVALTGVSLAVDARLWEDWWRRGRR